MPTYPFLFATLSDESRAALRARPVTEQKDSPFSAPYDKTLNALQTEVISGKLQNVIVDVDLHPRELTRNQLMPASYAGPVVLRAQRSERERIIMPSNQFQYGLDNLRAIVRTLNALRLIDRYGVTRGEQYRGLALPATTASNRVKTLADAAAVISRIGGASAGAIASDVGVAKTAFRVARNRAHPDNGGRSEDWADVQDASRLLADYFKVASL